MIVHHTAVRRDALDPGFASNLSRLGAVSIHDAGKFMRAPSQTQRTLNARRDEYTNSSTAPPPGNLSISALEELLDRIKSLPAAADRASAYEEYGIKPERMEEIRIWVNSPSVGGEVEVRIVDGREIREMQVSPRGRVMLCFLRDARCVWCEPHTVDLSRYQIETGPCQLVPLMRLCSK